MKNKRITASLMVLFAGFFWLHEPAFGELPKEGFPIGRADLKETRTIKELRRGLTHVHVERVSQTPLPDSKLTLSYKTPDKDASDKARIGFEKMGIKVRQEVRDQDSESGPIYALTAGEFDSMDEARKIAYIVPVPVQIIGDAKSPEGSGPYVLDIVILDPKKYRGKIISAWSERIWRASPFELALKHNAVVATNGSWFEYSIDDVAGVPSSISIVEGMWHHEYEPRFTSGAIVFIDNDAEKGPKLSIGYTPPPAPEVKWGNGKSMALDGIDRLPDINGNELVVMGDELFWHSKYSHGGDITKMLSMRMIQEASSGATVILLATGDKRAVIEDMNSTFDEVSLDLSIPNRPGLNALFTFNLLIENGFPTAADYSHHGPTSRTAIGADAEGKIYLMTAAINTSLYKSIGASLEDLRNIGMFLGLVNLANMDGGVRSTSMVIEGRPLGDPHMQLYEDDRRVADSILIVDDE